jgi:hypothetical protein
MASSVRVPHFAWPFRHGRYDEQGSSAHALSCGARIAVCPLGYRNSRPEFGWPFPTFDTEPLDLTPLTGALVQFGLSGAAARGEVYADLVDQAIEHMRVSIVTKASD